MAEVGLGDLGRRRSGASGAADLVLGDSVADAHDHEADLLHMRVIRN
jgi:hypothetical protein